MDRKRFIFFVLLVVLSINVMGLEPDERAYIEQGNQKVVAQISSKIDTQVNRLEENYKTEFERQKQIMSEEVSREVKSHLKGLTIGIAGIIIISLGVFRILDLKLTRSKNIIKYENELKEKIEQLNAYEKILTQDNAIIKQYLENATKKPKMFQPIPEQKKDKKKWVKVLQWITLVVVLLILFGLIGFLVYKAYFSGGVA